VQAAAESIKACSGGGGGALDHAGHQRCSAIHGESQAVRAETLSTLCDQAVFVDEAASVSLSPDTVPLEIDRFR
jgi:hypothetical protein